MWALAASTSAADRLPELRTTDLCRRRQTAEILIVARPAAGGGPRALRRQGRAPGRARAAPQGRRAGARARPQDLRVGDRGKTVAGVELSVRVARSRDLVAAGYPLSAVARAARISRQALYRTPKPRRSPQRRPPADQVEAAIVEIAKANQTDGYRVVTAFVRRRLGVAVNRKRVLRVMRERKLIQRRRPVGCQNSLRAPRNPRFGGRTLFLAPHTATRSSRPRRAAPVRARSGRARHGWRCEASA